MYNIMWTNSVDHLTSLLGSRTRLEVYERAERDRRRACSRATHGLEMTLNSFNTNDFNKKHKLCPQSRCDLTLDEFTRCEDFSALEEEMKRNDIMVRIWGKTNRYLEFCELCVNTNGQRVTSIDFSGWET